MSSLLKSLRTRSLIKTGGLLLTAGLGLLTGAARPAVADHALIIGINRYPNLPKEAQLGGPVNDAAAMGQKFKSLGFTVSALTDGQATKTDIQAALEHMQTANTDRERFVFYFAGHGAKSPDGSGVILASDASPANHSNYLTKDDLYAAIVLIPAKARTVLLDSCFSGAMQGALPHSKGLHLHRKSRYYDFFGLAAKDGQAKKIERVNDNDDPKPRNHSTPVTQMTDAVCYFVAANPYQPAYEDEVNGRQDGIFTHYLLSRLNAHPETWQAVQTDVTGNVMGFTEGTQTPCLTAGYSPCGVFDGPGRVALPPNAPYPRAKNVWDVFSGDQKDSRRILLEMMPDRSTVALQQKFKFQITIGSAGYLVLLELDTEGRLNLVSPSSRNAADAYMPDNTTVTVPGAGKAFTVNKEGAERVKAIVFSSEAAAKQFLDSFPDTGTISSWRKAQDCKIQFTQADPFFTSAVGFVVSGTN